MVYFIDIKCFFCLILFVRTGKPFILFHLGDSIDGYGVADWCSANGRPINVVTRYGIADDLTIKGAGSHAYFPDALCHNEIDIVGVVHLYGSDPKGPYLHDISAENWGDPFLSTPERMARGLELFMTRVATPDMILFHTTQWDIQGLIHHNRGNGTALEEINTPGSNLWKSFLSKFETDTINRLNELESLVDNYIAQGNITDHNRPITVIRTAVWNTKGGALLHAMNEIIRRLAHQLKLSFYDIDNDIWGSADWDYSKSNVDQIFRDWIHPIPFYTRGFTEKLIGQRYSSYLSLKSKGGGDFGGLHSLNNMNRGVLWLGEGSAPLRVMDVKLVREKVSDRKVVDVDNGDQKREEGQEEDDYWNSNITSVVSRTREDNSPRDSVISYVDTTSSTRPEMEKLYIYAYDNITHHVQLDGPVDKNFRLQMHLSPGDVLHLPGDVIQRLHTDTREIPVEITHGIRCAVNLSTGEAFQLHTGERRLISNEQILHAIGFKDSDVLRDVEDHWVLLTTELGPPIPDIYHENSLVRYHQHKECLAFLDGTWHSIRDVGVFFKHGWDFDQVVVLQRYDDIEVPPRGETLSRERLRRLMQERQGQNSYYKPQQTQGQIQSRLQSQLQSQYQKQNQSQAHRIAPLMAAGFRSEEIVPQGGVDRVRGPTTTVAGGNRDKDRSSSSRSKDSSSTGSYIGRSSGRRRLRKRLR